MCVRIGLKLLMLLLLQKRVSVRVGHVKPGRQASFLTQVLINSCCISTTVFGVKVFNACLETGRFSRRRSATGSGFYLYQSILHSGLKVGNGMCFVFHTYAIAQAKTLLFKRACYP